MNSDRSLGLERAAAAGVSAPLAAYLDPMSMLAWRATCSATRAAYPIVWECLEPPLHELPGFARLYAELRRYFSRVRRVYLVKSWPEDYRELDMGSMYWLRFLFHRLEPGADAWRVLSKVECSCDRMFDQVLCKGYCILRRYKEYLALFANAEPMNELFRGDDKYHAARHLSSRLNHDGPDSASCADYGVFSHHLLQDLISEHQEECLSGSGCGPIPMTPKFRLSIGLALGARVFYLYRLAESPIFAHCLGMQILRFRHPLWIYGVPLAPGAYDPQKPPYKLRKHPEAKFIRTWNDSVQGTGNFLRYNYGDVCLAIIWGSRAE